MGSNDTKNNLTITPPPSSSSSTLKADSLLMSFNQFNNNNHAFNSIYEQMLQRNLALFNQHQQQQQQNLLVNSYNSTIQPPSNKLTPLQSELALDYQLRYRTLMSTATSCLPYSVYQQQRPIIENNNNANSSNTTSSGVVENIGQNLLAQNESCRLIKQEEPKPTHSYIGLIALAILSTPEKKLVLSDIYQWILDNYNYFRNRGPGWRNSIRHNLSLNDCFIKCGRSANGKGHYWTIHPANLDDFSRGDFRRRRAQRRVRKSLGLTVPEEEEDDDEYEGEEEYDDDLAASSISSVSPVQKTFENNNNESQYRKRNCETSSLDKIQIPEKKLKQSPENDKIILSRENNNMNGSNEENVSISEHSNSDYNTTADEIDDAENNKVNIQLSSEITRKKNCFNVASLLAPEKENDRKINKENISIERHETDDLITSGGINNSTNLSTSLSGSLSSVSSSSSSSSPIPSSNNTTETNSNISQTELNINQSTSALINAASFYRNYCMLSNNPLFLYQLPSTVFNLNHMNPNSCNNPAAATLNQPEMNTVKEKTVKQAASRNHHKGNRNNDTNRSNYHSMANNSDVEKWNQTFSKIMARSYKNHNLNTTVSINTTHSPHNSTLNNSKEAKMHKYVKDEK